MSAQEIVDNFNEKSLSDRFTIVLDKSTELEDWEILCIKGQTKEIEVYPVTWGEDEYIEYHALNDKGIEICVIEEYLNREYINLLEVELD